MEDPDLLRGRGSFVDNVDIGDEAVLSAVFVRSPVAHAEIQRIGTAAAAAAVGVVAVLTADDLGEDWVPAFAQIHDRVGRPALAVGRVRFVGDPVALVVARTRRQAVDAAELVEVDYAELEPAVDMEAALAKGAPLQFPELGTNIAAYHR